MSIAKLCWHAIQLMLPPEASSSYSDALLKSVPARIAVCQQVARAAVSGDVCPPLAVAIALRETAFTHSISNKGARGPLGVIPKYIPKSICKNPRSRCDYTKAGIAAFNYWYDRHPADLCTTLAKYNAGNKGSCTAGALGYSYAVSVMSNYQKLLSVWEGDCSEYELGC